MLVNDLDLELEAPDGTIFYPWKLGQVILDSNGVVIADAAQTPGTNVTVSLPINPNPAANPGNPNEPSLKRLWRDRHSEHRHSRDYQVAPTISPQAEG